MSHQTRQCQDCGKLSRARHVIWFKGRYRCGVCKLKASLSVLWGYTNIKDILGDRK